MMGSDIAEAKTNGQVRAAVRMAAQDAWATEFYAKTPSPIETRQNRRRVALKARKAAESAARKAAIKARRQSKKAVVA